jgi:hypothetical protein
MDDLDVTVITSMTDIFCLKEGWENILAENQEDNLYYSFDWFYAASFFYIDPIDSPFIVCVKKKQKLIAILPCCIMKKRLRLFSFNRLELIGNIYSAYRGGIVLKGKECEVASAIVDFLLKYRAMWDILHFEDIPESDPFLAAAIHFFAEKKGVIRLSEQYAKLVIDAYPGMRSADYWRKLGKNLKQHIRAAINRMNRNGGFIIVPTTLPDQDIQTAMDHYYEIFSHSWKEPEIDPQFHRKLAAYLLTKGKLRLFTLYFKKEETCPDDIVYPILSYESDLAPDQKIPEGYLPIATSFYAVNGRYACLLKTAYREDHAVYSSGTVLSWFVVKWLLDKDHVTMIDFQKEADAYKFKWGRIKERHMRLQVANTRSPKAVFELWTEKTVVPVVRKIKESISGRLSRPMFRQYQP